MLASFSFFPALFFITDVFETLNELAFVVRVIVFAYLVYWFYITFRDAQMVFGISVAILGYLIFVHSISVTLLAIIFFVFVIFGNILQMLLMFSILPILGYQFTGREYVKAHTAQELEQLQSMALQKLEAGQELSGEEMQLVQQMQVGNEAQVRMGLGRLRAAM